jgi:hypothetical protein
MIMYQMNGILPFQEIPSESNLWLWTVSPGSAPTYIIIGVSGQALRDRLTSEWSYE